MSRSEKLRMDERFQMIRVESAKIMEQGMLERERKKARMREEAKLKAMKRLEERHDRVKKWICKTQASPFAVDLVAEDERIVEENKIREEVEVRRSRLLEKRKEDTKHDIVIRALTESSDLDALRREKRAIMEEEKRLRALLALEKASAVQKEDRLAAKRAEQQRRDARNAYRREQYRGVIDSFFAEEGEMLRRKHNVLPPLSPGHVIGRPKAGTSRSDRHE